MSDGGMLDYYLIAQALGWEWNFWTILTMYGVSALIFILAIFVLLWVLNK